MIFGFLFASSKDARNLKPAQNKNSKNNIRESLFKGDGFGWLKRGSLLPFGGASQESFSDMDSKGACSSESELSSVSSSSLRFSLLDTIVVRW